jgi:hypothetical protein
MVAGWESAVDKQIREAQERGEFDNLPGSGKPLSGLNEPYDENWWVKGLLRREALPDDPSLRKEIEALPARVGRLTLESSVREIVADLNKRIKQHGTDVPTVDVTTVVETWRASRATKRPPLATIQPAQIPARSRSTPQPGHKPALRTSKRTAPDEPTERRHE